MNAALTILLLALGAAAFAADAQRPAIAHTHDWRAAVRQFAEANLKHPAWGASHSLRDYELAKELAAADKVTLDDDVLYAAAYLHDVAAFAPFRKQGVDHQDQAADIVESLLAGTGFPMTKIDAVRGAIRTHMFARDPVGPEAIYLHDADALDWLGAIGVARVFGIVDPDGGRRPDPMPRSGWKSRSSTCRRASFRPRARRAHQQRVRELEGFLRNLRSQSSDLRLCSELGNPAVANELPISAAAERNKDPILTVLESVLPATGSVLEIASGTGQHVCFFAQALPGLHWQPSEPDAPLRDAIEARVRESGLTNVAAPFALDVHESRWPVADIYDAIICINMIHISPWSATTRCAVAPHATCAPAECS